MHTSLRTGLILAVLATGCMKTSATYCAKNGADDPENCPPVDAAEGPACTSNDDCTASPATLVCNTSTQACVECNAASSQTAACNGFSPVCGADDTCRACRTHDDCSTRACLPDGSCGTDANVAFVDGQQGGGSECTRAMPCIKLVDALAVQPRRPFIKITGTLDENVTIQNRDVTVIADPGALVAKGSGRVISVEGTSNVTIYDLQIGTPSSSSQIGVELASGATGTTALHRVRIVNTTQGAVRAIGGKLVLERSRIVNNPGGGVSVSDTATDFAIRNNFILFNGRATGTTTLFGGVVIGKNSSTSAVEFNTIAYNESTGAQNRAGLSCFGTSNVVGGNLVFANRSGTMPNTDINQIGGDCPIGTSLGLGMAPLGLVQSVPDNTFDPHLTSAAPATVLDAGGPCAARVPVDFDGDARPSGAACDLGADELTP